MGPDLITLKERYNEAKAREHYARETANRLVWECRDAEIEYSEASDNLREAEKELEKSGRNHAAQTRKE